MGSSIVGMVGVFCLVVPAIFLGGGSGFFNVPSVVICALLPISLALASAGASDVGRALRALRCLLVAPREADLTPRNAQVLRHMISYAYAAGVVGALIGLIQALSPFGGSSTLPMWVSLTLLTLLYSVFISECVLRPAARRIEGEWEKANSRPERSCDATLCAALHEASEAHRSFSGSPQP